MSLVRALHGLWASCQLVAVGFEAGWATRSPPSHPVDLLSHAPRLAEKGGGIPLFDQLRNLNTYR